MANLKPISTQNGTLGEVQSTDTLLAGTIRITTSGGASPSVAGEMVYDPTAGEFVFQDSLGTFNPRGAGGGGITANDHKTLLQLIHFIDEGPAEGFTSGATKATTPTGDPFPTQILWRRADTTKLVEQNITYTDIFPTTVEWKMYAADGTTVLATVTDSISYSGPFESSRTRTIA